MRRREFITLLGGAMAWPFAANAQKPPVRIGFLGSGSGTSPIGIDRVAILKEGLRENGLIEGRDYVLETRFAASEYDRFPDLARELAQAGVAIIVTNTIASVRAAQKLSPSLPIVMSPINDPVGVGLVSSLARPGGNTTGIASLNEDLTPKLLEYQRAILPKACYGARSNLPIVRSTRARILLQQLFAARVVTALTTRRSVNGRGRCVLRVGARSPMRG